MYPAQFLLIATMKPCPCGFYGDPLRECTCSPDAILSYYQNLQEILRNCFDMEIEVPIMRVDVMKQPLGELSMTIRQRFELAREMQRKRYMHSNHLWVNADLRSLNTVQQYCRIDSSVEMLLSIARRQLDLTLFQLLQILRTARTIADLAEAETITTNHLAEAIQYRPRFRR